MRRVLAYSAVAAVALVSFAYVYQTVTLQRAPLARTVYIGGQTIRVTVADTPEKREQGLSGRVSLAPDEGMLFVFPTDGEYGFWMKDMRFPIDILWLAADGTIVYMVESVAPDSYPRVFRPDTGARFVLELSAGYAEAHQLNTGDRVQL